MLEWMMKEQLRAQLEKKDREKKGEEDKPNSDERTKEWATGDRCSYYNKPLWRTLNFAGSIVIVSNATNGHSLNKHNASAIRDNDEKKMFVCQTTVEMYATNNYKCN